MRNEKPDHGGKKLAQIGGVSFFCIFSCTQARFFPGDIFHFAVFKQDNKETKKRKGDKPSLTEKNSTEANTSPPS